MEKHAPDKLIVKVVDATTGDVVLEHNDVDGIIAVMKTEKGTHQLQSVNCAEVEYVVLVKRLIETVERIKKDNPHIYFLAQMLNTKFREENI